MKFVVKYHENNVVDYCLSILNKVSIGEIICVYKTVNKIQESACKNFLVSFFSQRQFSLSYNYIDSPQIPRAG